MVFIGLIVPQPLFPPSSPLSFSSFFPCLPTFSARRPLGTTLRCRLSRSPSPASRSSASLRSRTLLRPPLMVRPKIFNTLVHETFSHWTSSQPRTSPAASWTLSAARSPALLPPAFLPPRGVRSRPPSVLLRTPPPSSSASPSTRPWTLSRLSSLTRRPLARPRRRAWQLDGRYVPFQIP